MTRPAHIQAQEERRRLRPRPERRGVRLHPDGRWSKHSNQWGTWLETQRKTAQLTARQLAHEAKLEPSYISKMEREGLVPNLGIAIHLALTLEAFGVPREETMVQMGYAPVLPPHLADWETLLADPPPKHPLDGLQSGLLIAWLEAAMQLPPAIQRHRAVLVDFAVAAVLRQREIPPGGGKKGPLAQRSRASLESPARAGQAGVASHDQAAQEESPTTAGTAQLGTPLRPGCPDSVAGEAAADV